MEINAWGHTDVGLKRNSNQDSFLVNKEMNLYIVADGMGGHKGGEVASKLSIKAVEDFISSNKNKLKPRDLIQKSILSASNKVFDESSKNSNLKGMGTTVVMAYIDGQTLYTGNVGDSRVYLVRDSQVWAITEDHSLVYEQIRSGALSRNNAEKHTGKNIITRSVGYERDVEADFGMIEIRPGDRFIICSDGLHGLVSHSKLRSICLSTPVKSWVDRLIFAAKKAGGDDNISIITISCT